MKRDTPLHPVVRRFIEDAGSTTQSFGIGRVLGQIYAYLYFSRHPRSLKDMHETLGISKGSASMGVRQLEQWHAVRKVWVRGDRKDYYEANDWFGEILRHALLDLMGRKMSAYNALLRAADADLAQFAGTDGDEAFMRTKIRRLRDFHDRAQGLWNGGILGMLRR